MRNIINKSVFIMLILLACCAGYPAGVSAPQDGIGLQVEQYLAEASIEPPERGLLKALIIPDGTSQAAYETAAYVFKALDGMRFDTVVLVGQSQGLVFPGASVYPDGKFETPYGPLPVDLELVEHLTDPASGVIFNPHVTPDEYAGTFVLASLKRVLVDCKVVPLLLGAAERKTYSRLTAILANEATKRRKRVLLVAITGLSSMDATGQQDFPIIKPLKDMDMQETKRLLRSGEAGLTAGNAVLLVMESVRRAGAEMGKVFRFNMEKSGDDSLTGHVAIGFYNRPLNNAERVEVLTLAWQSVEAAAQGKEFEPARVESLRLLAPGAAFVTLEDKRRLRGGMGQVQATGPLYRSIITSARAAAMKDSRFPPVSTGELNDINYEVSILTPLVPVLDARKDIELGTHGLYMRLHGHSGMLLPQVPVEQRWDLDEYLRQISLRAGLSPDAWKDKDARLWSFTTEIVR